MSAAARAEAARLREKYARTFAVPLEDVEVSDEGYGDRFFVWAPGREELPRWGTGEVK